jgi:lipopolysaccharide/colanic/teichoic acid biosynthesis glycosyltransferase
LIHTLIRIRLNVDVPMGLATFPDDGLIYRDLVDAALLNRITFDDKDFPTPSGTSTPFSSSKESLSKISGNKSEVEERSFVKSFRSLFRRLLAGGQSDGPPDERQYHDPDFWVNKLPYQSASARMFYRAVKRTIDFTLVALAGLFIVPVAALVALAVYLDDGRPIFFTQMRTGLGGKPFKMYKFRSMVRNAPQRLKEMGVTVNERGETIDKNGDKLTNDPRVTRVGRLIRKTSLDELPQLWNILVGHMSIVGPRPTSFGVDKYTLIQTHRLSVKPGLTGLWQVYARGDTDFDNRLIWDIKYIDKMSLSLDIQIMIHTVLRVLKQHGAR